MRVVQKRLVSFQLYAAVTIISSTNNVNAFSGNTGGAFRQLLKDKKPSKKPQDKSSSTMPVDANQPTVNIVNDDHVDDAFIVNAFEEMAATSSGSEPIVIGTSSMDIDFLQAEIDSQYDVEGGLLHTFEMAKNELEEEESRLRHDIKEDESKRHVEMTSRFAFLNKEDEIRSKQEEARRIMLGARMKREKEEEITKIQTKRELARRNMMKARFESELLTNTKVVAAAHIWEDVAGREPAAVAETQYIATVASDAAAATWESAGQEPAVTEIQHMEATAAASKTQKQPKRKELQWLLLGEKEARIRATRRRPQKIESDKQGSSQEVGLEKTEQSVWKNIESNQYRIRTGRDVCRKKMLEARLKGQKAALDRARKAKGLADLIAHDMLFKSKQEMARRMMMQKRFQSEKTASAQAKKLVANAISELLKSQQELARREMMEARFQSEKTEVEDRAKEEGRFKALEEPRLNELKEKKIALQHSSKQAKIKFLKEQQVAKEEAITKEKELWFRTHQERARRIMLETRLEYDKKAATKRVNQEAAKRDFEKMIQEEGSRHKVVQEGLQSKIEEKPFKEEEKASSSVTVIKKTRAHQQSIRLQPNQANAQPHHTPLQLKPNFMGSADVPKRDRRIDSIKSRGWNTERKKLPQEEKQKDNEVVGVDLLSESSVSDNAKPNEELTRKKQTSTGNTPAGAGVDNIQPRIHLQSNEVRSGINRHGRSGML